MGLVTIIPNADIQVFAESTLEDGLVAYWDFDEGQGTTLNDVSGNGNNGIVVGGATWVSGTTCKSGNCLSFDGLDDHVIVADNNLLDVGTTAGKKLSISLWYESKATGEIQFLMHKGTGGSASIDYTILLEGNLFNWGTGSAAVGDPCAFKTVTEPSANELHHVVVTLDQTGTSSGDKKIFIDNVLVASCSYTAKAPSSISPLFISGDELGNNIFDGLLDEIRIYDRVLTVDEILQLFTAALIPVDIDIKPGSDPNSVDCKSKGDVPFAILSDNTFDATTIPIELVSMSLVSSGPIQVTETHNQLHLEDVNGDGLLDGVLHIKTSDICLFIPDGTPIRSTIVITLSGETTDGQAFEGSDNIVLKGKKILEN